jgi:cytochrome b
MKVWDLPTRLFHWTIVLLIGAAWYSAESGLMEWHYRAGISAVGLVAFRLIWGFVGSRTARFASFLRSPRAVADHLLGRSATPPRAGHNPLGGYSVITMLAVLVLQVSTGVLAVDVDGIESGPLSYLVSFDDGRFAAEIHSASFVAIQVLVVLHVLAIAVYRLRGRRLVMPMITGRDPQLTEEPEGMPSGGSLRALVSLVAASGVAWWINAGAPM